VTTNKKILTGQLSTPIQRMKLPLNKIHQLLPLGLSGLAAIMMKTALMILLMVLGSLTGRQMHGDRLMKKLRLWRNNKKLLLNKFKSNKNQRKLKLKKTQRSKKTMQLPMKFPPIPSTILRLAFKT